MNSITIHRNIGEFFSLDPWSERWDQILHQCRSFDVYHTSAYHRIAAKHENLTPRLFVYRHKDTVIALPLLLASNYQSVKTQGIAYCKAVSVYGYAGPVTSEYQTTTSLQRRFCDALEAHLREMNIVSVSSRLHPLLNGSEIIRHRGEVIERGNTVSIDLRPSDVEQYSQYRDNHKRNLNRLTNCGYTTMLDKNWSRFDEFVAIYNQHMNRLRAEHKYLFGDLYFDFLRNELRDKIYLFVCERGEEIAAAALFFVCNGFAQYHLAATENSHAHLSPLKQVIDVARREFWSRGCSILHLGGGLGAKNDSLLHFKSGFSKHTHKFLTWHWQIEQSVDAL